MAVASDRVSMVPKSNLHLNKLKNARKRQGVIQKKNKSMQDLKFKMEKKNRKQKNLKNVSNKASKPKSKTPLEQQIALNKQKTGLNKKKSKSGMFDAENTCQ